MSEENEDVPLDETSDVHDDETPAFEEVEEQMDLSEHVEPVDPLEEAIQRRKGRERNRLQGCGNSECSQAIDG